MIKCNTYFKYKYKYKYIAGVIDSNMGRNNIVLELLPLLWVYVSCHHHKHQGSDPLIRSVSRVTAALTNISKVFQLVFFLVACSHMILEGFSCVVFVVSVKAMSSCIRLTCLVCL